MMQADLFTGGPIVRRSATLSDCGRYRWTLTRMWGTGRHVCWIGVNPSTADAANDDPTVRRWMSFSQAWGYDGFSAVNLYPFRSSSPAECRRWAAWEGNGPDWHARDAIHANVGIVASEAKSAALVVACWGAAAWDDVFVEHVCEAIEAGEEPWPVIHCIGTTGSGAPKHPLARGAHRVPDDARPVPWRRRLEEASIG